MKDMSSPIAWAVMFVALVVVTVGLIAHDCDCTDVCAEAVEAAAVKEVNMRVLLWDSRNGDPPTIDATGTSHYPGAITCWPSDRIPAECEKAVNRSMVTP